MPLDVPALVDEVCGLAPGEQSQAVVFLKELLLKRRVQTARYSNYSVEDARARIGEIADADLTDGDADYIVSRLVDHLDATERPNTAVIWILDELRFDHRVTGPAIRLLRRSLAAADQNMESNGHMAVSVVAPFVDNPEVLAALTEAAESGKGDVGESARNVLDVQAAQDDDPGRFG